MKLVMDEKLKHRLIGLSVILSLGAIFLPAMMKKSSQRLESNFSVNVKLPPKPVAANVVITDEEKMFKTIKVAQLKATPTVKSAPVNLDKDDFITHAPLHNDVVVKVEPVSASIEKPLELALASAAQSAVKKQVSLAENKPAKPVVKVAVKAVKAAQPSRAVVKMAAKQPAAKNGVYAVQLASFSKLSNAQALVSRLQSKGYKASYSRIATRNGVIYKVYAGHSPIKNNVVKLRTQLATAMQLNGFVVNTGVS